MKNLYRDHVLRTILFLEETTNNLFVQILNLTACTDDLPFLKEQFKTEAIFKLDINIFKGCKDPHVNRLIELYKTIENERLFLMNSYGILEDEIDTFFNQQILKSNDQLDDENLFDSFSTFLN